MKTKLLLLPGLDGTGQLFQDFLDALDGGVDAQVVRYSADQYQSYDQLQRIVEFAARDSEPFILLAESFSAPLAIQFAASTPPNLRGVILCAGFATSPVSGSRRRLYELLAPLAFQLPLFAWATRHWLVGPAAPTSLVAAVRSAVASVQPDVLATRIRAVLACNTLGDLRRVEVPVFYLRAKQDRLIGESSLQAILRIKPRTTIFYIDGPHLLLQCEPEQTAQIVMRILDQLD